MDLRTLRTFLKAADLESFTKAAEELNYVQSTVTSQIQQLERELGFPLFDRIGKRVFLTPLGREFRPYAENVLAILQQAYALGKSPREMQGTLRFGVLESLLFARMVNLLPHYQQLFPNIDVQIVMGTASELYQQLDYNQIDMAYLSHDLNRDPDLVCTYQRKERIVFTASQHHPLAGETYVSLEKFLSYPLIVTERTGVLYGRLSALAASNRLIPTNTLIVNNTKAIAEILSRSEGLSFLPQYSITEELRQGTLVELSVDVPPQIYYSQVLYHRKKWVAPFMSDLVDLIRTKWPETV